MEKILILLSILLIAGCTPEDENVRPTDEALAVGDRLPEFDIWDVTKQRLFIAGDYFPDGYQAVLFYLFDTSCSHCRAQSPQIVDLWSFVEANIDRYYLVCIARGDEFHQTEAVVVNYWQELAAQTGTAPAAMPPLYWDKNRRVYNKFAASGVPRLYVVSPAGIVTWECLAEAAPVTSQELIGHLEAALAE